MLLPVIGLRSKDEENNHRSSSIDNIITPLLSTGIAKCGYSTAAEQQSKLALGMALSSVPTAIGRLWFHRRKLNQHHHSQAMLRHIDRNDSSFTTTAKFAGSKALSSRGAHTGLLAYCMYDEPSLRSRTLRVGFSRVGH